MHLLVVVCCYRPRCCRVCVVYSPVAGRQGGSDGRVVQVELISIREKMVTCRCCWRYVLKNACACVFFFLFVFKSQPWVGARVVVASFAVPFTLNKPPPPLRCDGPTTCVPWPPAVRLPMVDAC